jgi:hypothetical protein
MYQFFNTALLHVSAVHIRHHQVGIGSEKRIKREEACLIMADEDSRNMQ